MANTVTSTTGLPDAKKHFNPLWLIAVVLIVILLALGILIYQNGAIKENTKPKEVSKAETFQEQIAADKRATEAKKAEEIKHLGDLDNVYGMAYYFAPMKRVKNPSLIEAIKKGEQSGGYGNNGGLRIDIVLDAAWSRLDITPGYGINDLDQNFVLLGRSNALANEVRRKNGQPEVASRLGGKFENAFFRVDLLNAADSKYAFHTFMFTAKLTMKDGGVLRPKYKVVIAEYGGEYYLYPVQKALVK